MDQWIGLWRQRVGQDYSSVDGNAIQGSIRIMNRGEYPTLYESTHWEIKTIHINMGEGETHIGWSNEPMGDVGWLMTYIFSTLR